MGLLKGAVRPLDQRKRKNRSIIDTKKAMVNDLDLPMFLSAKVCSTIVYIPNRCPHKVLKDKTPEEAFTS